MGRLTTHVLDTAAGMPAAGLVIDLYRHAQNNHAQDNHAQDIWHRLLSVTTNADGRCDAPLLEGADFTTGRYQLVFYAAAYLRAAGTSLPEIPFLDEIVIAFGIDDADQHYHVPLLLSPYGYSTYRGS
jgi:5-hydroxyisourate hydrolase